MSFQSVTFGMNLSHFKSCWFFKFLQSLDLQFYFLPILPIALCPKPIQLVSFVSIVLVLSRHEVSSAITRFFAWFNSFQLPDIFKQIAWCFRPTVDSGSEVHFVVCAHHIFSFSIQTSCNSSIPTCYALHVWTLWTVWSHLALCRDVFWIWKKFLHCSVC